MSSFALGTLISGLIFGKLMGKLGKNKLLYLSMIICWLGTIGFGLLIRIENKDMFLAFACTC